MGKVVKRIVLTGGPCAGKSSSLEYIKNYLLNKGYMVYLVQESATELIQSGIKPFGDNSISMVEFQYIIFKYQLFKEKLINDIAKNYFEDKEIVILYDRGLIDNKAYITDEDFDKLLLDFNLLEEEIMVKYDLVIHLETAAKSKWYTKENNKARSEDVSRAIIMDERNYKVWGSHNNLEYVKCYDDFTNKQKALISIIESNLKKNKKLVLK